MCTAPSANTWSHCLVYHLHLNTSYSRILVSSTGKLIGGYLDEQSKQVDSHWWWSTKVHVQGIGSSNFHLLLLLLFVCHWNVRTYMFSWSWCHTTIQFTAHFQLNSYTCTTTDLCTLGNYNSLHYVSLEPFIPRQSDKEIYEHRVLGFHLQDWCIRVLLYGW